MLTLALCLLGVGSRGLAYPGMKKSAGQAAKAEQEPGPAASAAALPGEAPPAATVAGLESLFDTGGTNAAASTSGDGVLEGHVEVRGATEAVIEGLEVLLGVVQDGKVVDERRTQTDGEGEFTFERLATGGTTAYFASVIFQGARYATSPVTFPDEKSRVEVSIPVYPSGPAPGKCRVSGMHVILDVDDQNGRVLVTEMLMLENPEKRTLVGSAEGTVTLVLNLPSGVSRLESVQGLQTDLVSLGNGILYYGGPIFPDTNQVLVSYYVSPATGWTFQRQMDMPIDAFDIFVRKSSLQINSPVLGTAERLEMRGTEFLRYHGGPFAPGEALTFRVEAAGTQSGGDSTRTGGGSTTFVVALLMAVGLSAFVGWPLLRRSPSPLPSRATDLESRRRILEQERDRHLLAAADLDFDFESGKLDEKDYHRLRAEHKQAAMKAMEALDRLETGGGAQGTEDDEDIPRFCTQCGKPLDGADRFCAYCGARVKQRTK